MELHEDKISDEYTPTQYIEAELHQIGKQISHIMVEFQDDDKDKDWMNGVMLEPTNRLIALFVTTRMVNSGADLVDALRAGVKTANLTDTDKGLNELVKEAINEALKDGEKDDGTTKTTES